MAKDEVFRTFESEVVANWTREEKKSTTRGALIGLESRRSGKEVTSNGMEVPDKAIVVSESVVTGVCVKTDRFC